MPLRTLFRHLLKYFLSESLSDNFLVLKKLLNLYSKFSTPTLSFMALRGSL